MGRVSGKVAIVTGAGSGIGKGSAIMLAREGARVVVVCRTAKDGEATVREIKQAGGEAMYVRADVSRTEDVKGMIKKTVEKYGRLDILFNNAGILVPFAPIQDYPEQGFDDTIAINLKGVWLGMKYAIPEMRKTGGGSIINCSSAAGAMGVAGAAAYSASKGGVTAMTRSVAVEVAAENIRVNVFQPAIIATPMLASMPPEQQEALIKTSRPRGKAGQVEEAAYAVLFLASDESSDITGAVLPVDGGVTAKHP